MKSAIEELILDGKGQLDFIPMSKESIAQSEKVSECEEKLNVLIGKNTKLKEALREFREAVEEHTWLEVLTHYKAGFHHGFLFPWSFSRRNKIFCERAYKLYEFFEKSAIIIPYPIRRISYGRASKFH